MAKKNLVGKPKNSAISYSDRKLEVLRTAAQLFNKQGYHSTTMDDIAAALGVTKPALYYYAKSKDEVLYEVISYALTVDQAPILDASNENHNAAEQLRVFFHAWAVHICGDFGRCLVQTKPRSLEAPTRRKNTSARRLVHKRVEEVLRLGMEDGSIRQCDPALTTLGLFDLYNGIAYWHQPKGRLSAEKIADQYWETFASGILTGK